MYDIELILKIRGPKDGDSRHVILLTMESLIRKNQIQKVYLVFMWFIDIMELCVF